MIVYGYGHDIMKTMMIRSSPTVTSVHFVLEYAGLQTTVVAAHIHVGQPNVNGGVTVFFLQMLWLAWVGTVIVLVQHWFEELKRLVPMR